MNYVFLETGEQIGMLVLNLVCLTRKWSHRRQELQLVALHPEQLPELDEALLSPSETLLAKVDTSRLTLPEPHFGQAALSAWLIVVRSSKRLSQDSQLYS